MKKEPKKYLPIDEYKDAADSLYGVSGMILFAFARHELDIKNLIIRNFIARVAMMLKGIFQLWKLSDYQDAWIIHRALLDRLFHLHDLVANDAFSEFDDWSFFEQYKAQNRVRSDSEFKHQAIGWVYELTDEQKSRAKSLSNNPPKWRRPKAEDVQNQWILFSFTNTAMILRQPMCTQWPMMSNKIFLLSQNLSPRPKRQIKQACCQTQFLPIRFFCK